MPTEDNETIEKCPHDPEHPYTMIRNDLIRDNSISPECRMLIIMLLSNIKTWTINVKGLQTQFANQWGRDKIYGLIKEAIEAGYMIRYVIKDKNLIRNKYRVSETPKFKEFNRRTADPNVEELNKCFRHPEFQVPERPAPENVDTKEITIKEETSKEVLSVVDDPVGSPLSKKIKFLGKEAKEQSIDESDIFAYAIRTKQNWRTEEISYAINALSICKAVIYDVWRFIEGTIRNLRITKKGEYACKAQTTSKSRNKENGIKDKSSEKDIAGQVSPTCDSLTPQKGRWVTFLELSPDFPFGAKAPRTS